MKNYFLIFLFVCSQNLFSQNLITNPGFEICDKCGQFGNPWVEFFGTSNSNNPVDWFAPSPGSSDIRDIFPLMGKRHGGFFSFGKYEYLANVLSTPLEVGAEYTFSFNLSVEPSGYTLDEIGVAFHSSLPYYNVSNLGKTLTPIFTTPDGEFLPASTYKKYSFTFKATGCEDHVIIGRFNELSNKNDTMWLGSGKPGNLINAYTFVDDVELVKTKDAEDLGLENSISLCPSDSKKIGIRPGFSNIKWSTGETNDSIIVNSNSGQVCVEVTINQNCPPIKECVQVTLNINLINDNFSLITKSEICFPHDSLIKIDNDVYPEYNWSTKEIGKTLKITSAGEYYVKGLNGCNYSEDTLIVLENQNVDSLFNFPNVFTPSAMENKNFGPVIASTLSSLIQSYDFQVYNRWGKRVFKTNDKNLKWTPDTDTPMDTYTYLLDSNVNTCKELKKIKKKGAVTLIR